MPLFFLLKERRMQKINKKQLTKPKEEQDQDGEWDGKVS